MEGENQKIESGAKVDERKNKIGGWLSDKHNLVLLGILILAFAVRIYYFFLTKNQPLWWDEAEYMLMARAFADGNSYDFIPVRPILFSLISAAFFKISPTEYLPRLLITLISFASVPGMYILGKEIWGKREGLIAALLTSVFWLDLFFSTRLLVDSPSMTFFIFSALFFHKYFKSNNPKFLYIGGVIIAFGTLIRLSTATFLIAIVIFTVVTERLKFVKKKEVWISALIFVLILSPYVIWGYAKFDGFVISQAGKWNSPEEFSVENSWFNFSAYVKNFPRYFSPVLLLMFGLGCLAFSKLLIAFDIFVKGKDKELNVLFFLFLLLTIPLVITSLSFDHHVEDRYIITVFPAAFLMASFAITRLGAKVKLINKNLGALVILAILIITIYSQLNTADDMIKSRLGSYSQLKESGDWIDSNLPSTAEIIAVSWPQTMYYSNREVIIPPETREEFDSLVQNSENSYLLLSIFENHPSWFLEYPEEKSLQPTHAWFLDSERTQVAAVLYKLK